MVTMSNQTQLIKPKVLLASELIGASARLGLTTKCGRDELETIPEVEVSCFLPFP